jgi:hypothetical protein
MRKTALMPATLTLTDAWESIAEIASRARHPDRFVAALGKAAALVLSTFIKSTAEAGIGMMLAQIRVSTSEPIPAKEAALCKLFEEEPQLVAAESLLLCSQALTTLSPRDGHYRFKLVLSEKMWQSRTRVSPAVPHAQIRMKRLYSLGSFQRRSFEEAKRGLARNRLGTRHLTKRKRKSRPRRR